MSIYSNWTEAELLQLIANGVRERDDLEYKSSNALRPRPSITRDQVLAEVSKDVSAMANANGGLILYGIEERNHLPKRLDSGFDLSNRHEPTHQWLEQVIRSHVRAAPEELFIKPIDLAGPPPDRVALLVEVGKSARGCQANDGRYYRRRNFGNEILVDWEVRELMARATVPQVELTSERVILSSGGRGGGNHAYVQAFDLYNRGGIRVRDWKVVIMFPKQFLTAIPASGGTRVRVKRPSGVAFDAFRIEMKNGDAGPLFPGDIAPIAKLQWRMDDALYAEAEGKDITAQWDLFADDMAPVSKVRLIREMHEF